MFFFREHRLRRRYGQKSRRIYVYLFIGEAKELEDRVDNTSRGKKEEIIDAHEPPTNLQHYLPAALPTLAKPTYSPTTFTPTYITS